MVRGGFNRIEHECQVNHADELAPGEVSVQTLDATDRPIRL